uniref:Nucleolar GTP-binding protein 1 n=1 Tax=Heterosigma akashiwo TaxID=2829 RepID=A0A6V1RDW6_HETAK|mmetsp:Transcript_5463/g.9490  ORF Transcript_5463/g.9490 Transcript_5463/m.9490 type:complete len:653 (-) Transcript_5463:432-2390(-)
MVVYNFKKIQPIPGAGDFVDIILSKTQRKTPTVVHPQYSIQRIRAFYMRKVKFTQQNISERLGQVIADFPRLDDIHPFYADLINILYDRDHYKLALGQLNTAKNLIEVLSRDYVRLMKYGDSLYRCKQLKRAAMGRMMTILKKQKAALSYLDEVRKHLGRLPALDPNTRTLLVTGYPNVGKSSFMNKVTRANVDVQPYAFTTKSLYVGHMDYRYLRWQVVDTPGLLDHPLEERNTIEMQAITALAHLQCCVLYFVDVSEQCGWTIAQQLALFESVRPLFANKQLLLVVNKIDQVKWEDLKAEDREAIEKCAEGSGAELMKMSNVSEEGVSAVKNKACDKLLTARVETRLTGKKVTDVMNRLTVAQPRPRDARARAAFIPESVLAAKNRMDTDKPAKRKTEKDLQLENGGAGVYSCDFRKYYDLKSEEWRWDVQPQILDGKNVADYVDPDIAAKLEQLEREEEQLAAEYLNEEDMGSDLDEEEKVLHKAVRDKKKITQQQSQLKRTNKSALPRRGGEKKIEDVKAKLDSVGLETEGIATRGRKRTRSLAPREEAEDGMEVDAMDVDGGKKQKRAASKSRGRSQSRGRSKSAVPPEKQGLKDEGQQIKAVKLMRKQRRKLNLMARASESDRKEGPKLVKWQIAGKSGLGTKNKR